MQDSINLNSDDEIDLRELFITLWAYKLFIAGTCALGVVFGGYYALNANKVFTSAAIFKSVIIPHVDIDKLDGKILSYKTLIIEWCQKNKLKYIYETYEDSGNDSVKHFTSSLTISSFQAVRARSTSKKKAEEKVEDICKKLLANLVIEDYRIISLPKKKNPFKELSLKLGAEASISDLILSTFGFTTQMTEPIEELLKGDRIQARVPFIMELK